MDPLSISVSLIAMVEAVEVFSTKLKTSTHASTEMRHLQAELPELEAVFRNIRTLLSSEAESFPDLNLHAISDTLLRFVHLQSSLKLVDTASGHSQLITKKSNIKKLRRQVGQIKHELKVLTIPPKPRPFVLGGITERVQSYDRIPGFEIGSIPDSPHHGLLRPSAENTSQIQRSTRRRVSEVNRSIRPCYVLIIFGFLTIVGSLVPALWRSISDHDVSGGFSLAQYILGVGALVLGCSVAIHSRTCTCWSSKSKVVPHQGGFLGLEAIENDRNRGSYE